MNFDFNIFGVPNGFDSFKGDGDAGDFQSFFYDGSRENAKLTIHRKASGQVSYSYLRYNFLANGSRAGSFLGMSVAFTNQYCTDPTKLYRLFETVYKDVILKRKVLLEKVTDNSAVQAKFLVNTFKEVANEINLIESVIRKNIDTRFANDFKPIDNTFVQGDENILVEINIEEGNKAINDELKKYHFVSISSEFKKRTEKLPFSNIKELEKQQRDITDWFAGLFDLNDENINTIKQNIDKFETNITETKKYIQPFLKYHQEELSQLEKDLHKNTEWLNAWKERIKNVVPLSPPLVSGINNNNEGRNEDKDRPKPSFEFLYEFDKIIKENIDDLKKGNNSKENFKKAENGIKNGKEKINNWIQEQYKLSKDGHTRLYLQNQSQLRERDLQFDSLQQQLTKLKPITSLENSIDIKVPNTKKTVRNKWRALFDNVWLWGTIAGISTIILIISLIWSKVK